MWQIDNRTPFAAGQSWVRNRDGAETWLVVIKATFDVSLDGSTELSMIQPEVTRSPAYMGEPARSSILYENDFVLAKQTTDVVLNGTAYAPQGAAIRSLDVGMQVGSVRKIVRVLGDRTWIYGGARLTTPEPFVRMPITYERAFGGIDVSSPHPETDWYWPNPVGTGFVSSRDRITRTRPPNIEYPDQLISTWQSRPAPAGLGVIASHWRDRAVFAGTYDDAWSEERQPLLPLDFDMRYYQAVPVDQQAAAFLLGGETVALLNLTPSGRFRFVLPQADLALETRFGDGERRQHEPPKLHTIILEPDFPRVSLVWHSAIECHAKVYQLEHTRIELVRQGMPNEEEEEVDDLLDLI